MARITILQNSRDAIDISAGQMLFKQGDTAEQMYVIIDGEIEVTVNGTVVGEAGPGEAMGEMALIDNSVRSATAVAKTDARVVPIDRRRFLFMVTETPNFALQLLSIMADRLRQHQDRLVG
jgi:CRP-like cAMP-binding protein